MHRFEIAFLQIIFSATNMVTIRFSANDHLHCIRIQCESSFTLHSHSVQIIICTVFSFSVNHHLHCTQIRCKSSFPLHYNSVRIRIADRKGWHRSAFWMHSASDGCSSRHSGSRVTAAVASVKRSEHGLEFCVQRDHVLCGCKSVLCDNRLEFCGQQGLVLCEHTAILCYIMCHDWRPFVDRVLCASRCYML
jgi:hypothetical protein